MIYAILLHESCIVDIISQIGYVMLHHVVLLLGGNSPFILSCAPLESHREERATKSQQSINVPKSSRNGEHWQVRVKGACSACGGDVP